MNCITSKAHAKTAFLQTGRARRDLYVKSATECLMKSTHASLLPTTVCGFVNYNAKSKNDSDQVMF